MTEEEAKKKWCPMAKQYPVGNQSDVTTHSVDCIASGCMMWKWINPLKVPIGKQLKNEKYGYCGLSGNPESAAGV
jgi:hypothetical protein